MRERPDGAEEARVFVQEVLRAAHHVPMQIAHLSGASLLAGYGPG